jgi:hypothetical protein
LSDHQISDDSPSGFCNEATAPGNRRALPRVTAVGFKPCCCAWAQKLPKSGGGSTPVTISTPPFLKALIWAE